jgi:hypothetical protein
MAGIIARTRLLMCGIKFHQGDPFGDLFGLTVDDGLMLDMMLPGFRIFSVKESCPG